MERLTDQERELFTGEQTADGWLAGRIEIDAIPVKDRVAWLEKRLPEARPMGADPDAAIEFTQKIIPPADELPELVDDAQSERLEELLIAEIDRQIRVPEITSRARELLEVTPATEADIRAALAENPEISSG